MNNEKIISYGIGRRKQAIAQAILKPGNGKLMINKTDGPLYLQNNPNYLQKISNSFNLLGIKNIYDVGAHKGNWSVAMNKELPDANFYLFEANSHHEEDLKKLDYQYYINVLSNNEKNIDFYSNNAGTGDSYYKENTSTYDTVKSKQITSKTLDDLVKKNKIPFPDFIKIDTQGSELDILNGAHDCLKNAQLLLLECPVYPFNSGAPTMPDYIDFLLKFNFYPSQCVELHNLSGVLIQIDILFLNKN